MGDIVLCYNLAPSTQLNYEEVVEVFNAITGLMCIDVRGVYQYISSLQPEPPTITPTMQLIQGEEHYHWMLQEQYDQTIYLGDKEASGRVVLGLFMSMVTKLLRSKYPTQLFYVDHEYKVLKG